MSVLLGLATAAVARPAIAELAVLAPGGGLCPGQRHVLAVTATDTRGRSSRVAFGPKDGITVTWELGPVTENGTITMPADPRRGWGAEGHLTVTSDADPKVVATASVPLRYDCPVVIDEAGAEGESGEKGEDGAVNSSTSDDRLGALNVALAAGSLHGTAGKPGLPGGPGSDVTVRVVRATEPRTGADVLQVGIRVGDAEETFAAIAVNGGELVVKAGGGAGGSGGAGGNGGTSGRVGGGGVGGDGGPGGTVVLRVDPSAESHVAAIVVENAGGLGGFGGPAGVRSQTSRPDGSSGPDGENGRPGADGPPVDLRVEPVTPPW